MRYMHQVNVKYVCEHDNKDSMKNLRVSIYTDMESSECMYTRIEQI